MLKIVQNTFPYDEIVLSFSKRQVTVSFLNEGQPVAKMSEPFILEQSLHLTQLEGKLRTTPQ